MKKYRLHYLAVSLSTGFLLVGLGWGAGNFYLVALGALFLAAGAAVLGIPMPKI
jgi:hypothetical protein